MAIEIPDICLEKLNQRHRLSQRERKASFLMLKVTISESNPLHLKRFEGNKVIWAFGYWSLRPIIRRLVFSAYGVDRDVPA